jgi:hypothetical protein
LSSLRKEQVIVSYAATEHHAAPDFFSLRLRVVPRLGSSRRSFRDILDRSTIGPGDARLLHDASGDPVTI